MSKIPLANGRPNTPESQALLAKARWKINFIVSLIALTVGGGLVALLEFFTLDPSIDKNFVLHLLIDAFGLAGILGFGFFSLGFIASKGAFDILSYSLKLLILNVFAPKYRQESFPKTFYDYKVKKDHEERKAIYPLMILSLAYLAIGILLLVIYTNL
ncbi:MAG: DUF3899 domain-containing protein [Bacilli bacterium]|nr:DUF3899 domain-containing protein [Bacilli bacterium]